MVKITSDKHVKKKIPSEGLLCYDCWRSSFAAGQAFTKYECKSCMGTYTHPNTAVPKLCIECSIALNMCRKCGHEIGLYK